MTFEPYWINDRFIVEKNYDPLSDRILIIQNGAKIGVFEKLEQAQRALNIHVSDGFIISEKQWREEK